MTYLLAILPFFLSFLTGTLLVHILLRKNSPWLVKIFLGGGLGLALHGYTTFLSFTVLGEFRQIPLITINAAIPAGLIIYFTAKTRSLKSLGQGFDFYSLLTVSMLVLFFIPVWFYANIYYTGGWDAWQVWNFKSKFMLTGGANWTNIFDPMLWRTSPHYPLLLPSINVWGWSFVNRPVFLVPIITALTFTFLTIGLLIAELKAVTGNRFSIFAGLSILSLSFFVQLATSQYCDILIAYYLLAAVVALFETYRTDDTGWAILAGCFTGALGFTKSEGLVACTLILFFGFFYLFIKNMRLKKPAAVYALVAIVASAPTVLFEILFSPGNQTFINGLTSILHPSSADRLKMIFLFLALGTVSYKWGGVWIALTAGLLVRIRHIFRRDLLILPAFLGSYFAIILGYYFINTYFKIAWWLQVTLGRLQFAVLPTVIFWVFLLICTGNKDSAGKR